ncbi:hypothetical protein QUF49_04440 [Fictibacillus sp. b24]|uniref:hypothetical protein n=1 Tax=Fictibacillus sp. b24 TaxID=3055863 RepID=UPI0025A0761B|nr:hypothetical protein [Fictibacillus sp. b24]MDM5315232.1 hypothetical protein [Fictibacillus sp. b24]
MMQPLKQESSDGAEKKQEKLNPISFIGKVKESNGHVFTIYHKKTVMNVKLDSKTELLDGDKTLDIAPDEAVQPGATVQVVGLLNKRLNVIKALRLYIFHKEFDINYLGTN